jgi:hypothetical protein
MPTGDGVLSEDDLGLLRAWIRGGAPEAGIVVPCGVEQGGPDRDCFAYNNVLLAQDPQSHHSIVEFYVPPEANPEQWDPTHSSWRNWTCLGGANSGSSCTPGSDECGERGQCATAPQTTVGCILYANGPPEMGNPAGLFGDAAVRINLATAQEATFREDYPPNVFSLMPVKGFVVWDSHAFNLTESDTSVEQWMNLEFATADEMVYQRQQIFDADDLFEIGRIEPFTSGEVCGTYTIPQHGQLLTLSSHTHRFGKHFRIWYPPNDICHAEDPGCLPNDREPDYTSFDYADPLYQRFIGDDILSFDSDVDADRTFKYCAVYDNGETDPSEVRRESMKPEAQTCDFVAGIAGAAQAFGINIMTCGCVPEERSCFGGPNQGMGCGGDDTVCGDGGICDACAAGGGVTTEEEMFLLLGSFYVETP